MIALTRRHLPLLCLALAAGPARAATQPWRIRFLSGGFTGEAYEGGLEIALDEGWKTYWRIPGAGGIPPEISASGDNLAGFAFDFPLPSRFPGLDGETIGYKEEVVFPFRATPSDLALPLKLDLAAFVGVCEQICIPVPYKQQLSFSPQGAPGPDAALLANWKARVPQVVENAVSSAVAIEDQGKPALALSLAREATDIFVEGSALHFFNAPRWTTPGREAVITVNGAKSLDALRAKTLRITLATAEGGVEQSLMAQ